MIFLEILKFWKFIRCGCFSYKRCIIFNGLHRFDIYKCACDNKGACGVIHIFWPLGAENIYFRKNFRVLLSKLVVQHILQFLFYFQRMQSRFKISLKDENYFGELGFCERLAQNCFHLIELFWWISVLLSTMVSMHAIMDEVI